MVSRRKSVVLSVARQTPPLYTGLPAKFYAVQSATFLYFGGKLVKNAAGNVHSDIRGSIGKYFPYGRERPSATADGREKFATYFRDADTGLDYADQRYHAPGQGRFMSPDPSWPGDPADPNSWNLYAYTQGDPINYSDPEGLYRCGDLTINWGTFAGQTLDQVMNGKSGEALMAQLMYHEAGAITNADIATGFAGYLEDLRGIGTAILNQWDVDNRRLSVYRC